MNKKLAIFAVVGVIAISGFSGVIAGSKVYAVESSNMQSLKDEIEETKQNEATSDEQEELETLVAVTVCVL